MLRRGTQRPTAIVQDPPKRDSISITDDRGVAHGSTKNNKVLPVGDCAREPRSCPCGKPPRNACTTLALPSSASVPNQNSQWPFQSKRKADPPGHSGSLPPVVWGILSRGEKRARSKTHSDWNSPIARRLTIIRPARKTTDCPLRSMPQPLRSHGRSRSMIG